MTGWLADQIADAQELGKPSLADPPFACPPDPVIGGVVLNLPMPPTTNNLFNGNGKRRYPTPQYKAWIKAAGWELIAQKPRPMDGPVCVLIEVSLQESADNWDVCNREKATMDLLVTHGVIQGDNRPVVREVTQRWADVDGVRVSLRYA